MNFDIKEFNKKVESKNIFIKVIMNFFIAPLISLVFLVLLLPILFFVNMFKKNKKSQEFEYETFFENKAILIERKFINENDFPDNLHYPNESQDIYLCKLRSNIEIKNLENEYFMINS